MQRTDAELKQQILNVFWHLRQVLHLSSHLEERRRAGTTLLVAPLDAAALEAFAVSARVLSDFVWRDRSPRGGVTPRADDCFAVDWFSAGEWLPGEKPPEMAEINRRVGEDIAHLSYRRLNRSTERGWQPLEVGHRLAYWLAVFAQHASPAKLARDFQAEVFDVIISWRAATAPAVPFAFMAPQPIPVASPSHPQSIAALR